MSGHHLFKQVIVPLEQSSKQIPLRKQLIEILSNPRTTKQQAAAAIDAIKEQLAVAMPVPDNQPAMEMTPKEINHEFGGEIDRILAHTIHPDPTTLPSDIAGESVIRDLYEFCTYCKNQKIIKEESYQALLGKIIGWGASRNKSDFLQTLASIQGDQDITAIMQYLNVYSHHGQGEMSNHTMKISEPHDVYNCNHRCHTEDKFITYKIADDQQCMHMKRNIKFDIKQMKDDSGQLIDKAVGELDLQIVASVSLGSSKICWEYTLHSLDLGEQPSPALILFMRDKLQQQGLLKPYVLSQLEKIKQGIEDSQGDQWQETLTKYLYQVIKFIEDWVPPIAHAGFSSGLEEQIAQAAMRPGG